MNTDPPSDSGARSGLRMLLAGGVAALVASTCCLGPLVLITLGFSGAWISHLTALEPYQPIFMSAALLALALAGKRIWRPAAQCAPGEVCALPRVRRAYQLLFLMVLALVLAALGFPFIAPLLY